MSTALMGVLLLLTGAWWTMQGAAAVADPAVDKPTREVIRVATYNIEHFNRMFDQHMMPERNRSMEEYYRDEEDLYEVARTMRLPTFDADIIGLQESCNEKMLHYFNSRMLGGRYALATTFPGNTDGQWLSMLAKPGFEVLEIRAEYYKEAREGGASAPATTSTGGDDDAGPRMFGRGPAFVLFRSPGGLKFWVGVTHAKSKRGNDEAMTRQRRREIERTREICQQLVTESGVPHLVMTGDFNDDFGVDKFEEKAGNAVAAMIEGPEPTFTCVTKPLFDQNPNLATFHCELKTPQFRGTIDHIFASPAMTALFTEARLIDDPIATVASDHYPLMAIFESPIVQKP